MIIQATHTTPSRLAVRALGTLALTLLVTLALSAASHATAAAAEPCLNEAVRVEQGSTYLPECRGYELASPTQKGGSEVGIPEAQNQKDLYTVAAVEGSGVEWSSRNGLPRATSAWLFGQYLSLRAPGAGEWVTNSLEPESRFAVLRTGGPTNPAYFDYLSPSLSCGVEETQLPLAHETSDSEPELPPGETTEEVEEDAIANLYVRDTATDTYTLVTDLAPLNPTAPASPNLAYSVDGASTDCSHVFFETEANDYQLLAAAPAGKPMLYEYHEGLVSIAAVLPDGTVPAAGITADFTSAKEVSNLGQVSRDGTRAFFTAKSDTTTGGPGEVDSGYEEVFLREDGTTTVEASKSQTATPDTGARFQAASADGGRVFFTANYGLTASSSSGATTCDNVAGNPTGAGCDLYEYEVQTGTLTDISADTRASETGDTTGADVHGLIGISEDGGYVYFSAAGQLVPDKGNTQALNATNKEANVYLYHEGYLTYVTTIGEAEVTGYGTQAVDTLSAAAGLKDLVARVTPSGKYLLLATKEPITGYDNVDSVTGERDFEGFEYSAEGGAISCVSCDQDGVPPSTMSHGLYTYDGGLYYPTSGEIENDGYLRRNLSESGAAFFESVDPLVPQAANGVRNVYEWQPDGGGACTKAAGCISLLDSGSGNNASYFADASADGSNVFVVTYDQLAPQDTDELRDIYDVRVGGGSPAVPPREQCAGSEACQGPAPTLPVTTTPASVTGIGGGNLASILPPPVEATSKVTLTVVSHRVKSRTATIVVKVSGAGKVTATGKDVAKGAKSPASAKEVTFELKLTKAGVASIAKHATKALKVEVKLIFTPKSGTKVTKLVTVSFARHTG